jgi:hypothetical protein
MFFLNYTQIQRIKLWKKNSPNLVSLGAKKIWIFIFFSLKIHFGILTIFGILQKHKFVEYD